MVRRCLAVAPAARDNPNRRPPPRGAVEEAEMASHVTTARPRWAGILVLALVSAAPGCGDGAGSGGSDDASETPTENAAEAYDGTWSGTLSTGGTIDFTVTDGVITAGEIFSGEDVFGSRCGTVSGANEFPDAEIAIEDGEFSWGGPGEGYPVEGRFDSETTASGTAEFAPSDVGGEYAPGCSAATATWTATNGDATEIPTTQATESSTPTETTNDVSAASARCVAGLGYEITDPGAIDLPIADADGEGLPVIDGAAGIGIRGETGAGVFYAYGTDAQANAAYINYASNPDIDQVAGGLGVIAIDNVLVLSDIGFNSDDRFYLADCFD